MPKRLDRTGLRYGRLLVVKYVGKDNRGKLLWLCKCDCGNEKIVVGDNLSSGKSNSCGCLKKEFLSKSGNQYGLYENREEAIAKTQYNHIKRRHKKMKGKLFSFDWFYKLIKQPCFYCGLEYSKEIEDRLNESKINKKLSDVILKCNGVDRINSNIGYTEENTVPCCKYCNTAKNTMTQNEFKMWIKRVYKHYVGN